MGAFADFTNATGQHHTIVNLTGGKPLSGTFGWTMIQAEAKAPDGARRMRVFFGLLPATGTLLMDDISLKVKNR